MLVDKKTHKIKYSSSLLYSSDDYINRSILKSKPEKSLIKSGLIL